MRFGIFAVSWTMSISYRHWLAANQEIRRRPEGNYDSFIFKTVFEKKNPAAERVILIKQPVGWRIMDYRIY